MISARTVRKIVQLHGITEAEVRDSVQCVRGLYGRWDEDPERGRRALIDVVIRGRPATVVLYPSARPMGMLGSVYFVD
jgi:hypothetical protein